MTRRAHGLGLLLAVATLGTLLWGVDRPALWMDESASVVATQRTWPNLWHLLHGAEAPLVPYYVLLKVARSGVAGVSSAAAANPELIYRLPSVVAAVLAVWILTVWLARRWPVVLVLSSVVALLATGGFSRYGQEARPYAFALLAAVIATVAWSTMVNDPRRRWIALYAGSVVLLVGAHLLAGSLIAAHLIAALITTPENDKTRTDKTRTDQERTDQERTHATRRSAVVRTAIGAALGLAVVAPFALPASANGVGPPKDSPLTFTYMSTTFLNLFTEGTGFATSIKVAPLLGIGVLLLLAVVGLTQVFLPDYRSIARLAMSWALVPLLVLVPVMVARPNLILGRYLVFVLPGWAILTGLGVVTVADLVRRWSGRNVTVRTVTGGLAAVLVLTAVVATQADTLTGLRSPGGHTEDIRPALALADRPEYAALPIVLTSERALEIAVYNRGDEARLLGQRVPRDQTSIWPTEDRIEAKQLSGKYQRIVVLVRAPSTPSKCPGDSLAEYVYRCMPKWVRQEGYQVETAQRAGYKWTFAVLARDPGEAQAEV
jgi:hypothetical protein